MEGKMEQRFIMLVGLPGSGKSTFSKEMMEDRDDISYISSDEIREELFNDVGNQDNNGEVFNQMLIRTKEALNEGSHVIYDATNISKKKRRGLVGQLPRDIKKMVVYFNTPYKEVLKYNAQRERVVPQFVIDRMYKNLQTPVYSEGWDKIVMMHSDETLDNELDKIFVDSVRAGVIFGREGYELMDFLATYFTEFFKIYDLPQDSSYHGFSVSRHTYYAYKYILDNYQSDNETEKEIMLWAGLLHDIGKPFCKSFYSRKGEECKYANFIGHDNVGSQIAINFLTTMGFDDEFIYKVSTLIQYHMYLLDENASRDKLINYVGQDLYEKLLFLREADGSAH